LLYLFLPIILRIVNVAVPFLFADLVYVFEQGVTSPPWLFCLVSSVCAFSTAAADYLRFAIYPGLVCFLILAMFI